MTSASNARSQWLANSDPAAAMGLLNMTFIYRRFTAGESLRRYLRASAQFSTLTTIIIH